MQSVFTIIKNAVGNRGSDQMNNIIFKRIWQDEDFYEIEVQAQNKVISASANFYVVDEDLARLSKELTDFPFGSNKEIVWELPNIEGSPRELSLRIFLKDKLGHVKIEIYMVLKNYDEPERYNCFFSVSTEIGVLNRFGQRLIGLNKPVIGKSVSMVELDF